MKTRTPVEKAQDTLAIKSRELRLLDVNVGKLEKIAALPKFGESLQLLTEDEKYRASNLGSLFSSNYFCGCASKNADINRQVFATLIEVLEGNLDLNQFKNKIAQLKKQDGEKFETPYLTCALITLSIAVSIGTCAIDLCFFNPAEWVYPYGWMAVAEIFGGLISFLLGGLSAYFFTHAHYDVIRSLERVWAHGPGDNNGLKTIVNSLTSEDITFLQKINSKEWQNAYHQAEKKFKPSAAISPLEEHFDPVLNPSDPLTPQMKLQNSELTLSFGT